MAPKRLAAESSSLANVSTASKRKKTKVKIRILNTHFISNDDAGTAIYIIEDSVGASSDKGYISSRSNFGVPSYIEPTMYFIIQFKIK